MLDEHKQTIEHYLSTFSNIAKAPLIFSDGGYLHLPEDSKIHGTRIKNYPLDKAVLHTLSMSFQYASYNSVNNIWETSTRRWRSSFDIWRHILFFKPKITLIEVMGEIYNVRNELSGHYCPTVRRRVFNLLKNKGSRLYHNTSTDEYGLTFFQWS